MKKLYVYDPETMRCVDCIEGSTEDEVEKIASERWNLNDDFATTYTPAFGTVDGLHW